MKKRLLFIGALMVLAFAKAQDLDQFFPKMVEERKEITDTLGRDYDRRDIEMRELQPDFKEEYDRAEFDYIEVEDDSENFLSGFFNGIFNFIEDTFGVEVSPFWATLMEITVYVLMGILAVYIIIRVVSKESADSILGRSKNTPIYVKVEEAHIEDIDLDALIKENIAGGQYRNATRYMYLNTLKKLSRSGYIVWDNQKTNADYSRELKNPALKESFKEISYLYDHIWYGEFSLDQKSFNEVAGKFKSIELTA